MKGAVKSAITLIVVACLGLVYVEYRYAAGKLPQADGAVVTTGVCKTTASISGGTLPLTFEAFVKDAKGHNWLESGGAAGLVRGRLEWSHAGLKWVEDAGFAERQTDGARARQKLAARQVDALIKDLRSEDAAAREVASKELFVRSGQTMGYAYDAPAEEREKAAAAWEKWWADDRNKALVAGKEIINAGHSLLDGAEKVLETLRKYDKEQK